MLVVVPHPREFNFLQIFLVSRYRFVLLSEPTYLQFIQSVSSELESIGLSFVVGSALSMLWKL